MSVTAHDRGSPSSLLPRHQAARRRDALRAELQRRRAELVRRKKTELRARKLELARRKLLPFVEWTHEGYEAGWFHRVLCERLERFSAQVARGESPRLIISAPPRHGKTAIVSQRLPVWHMARHPRHEIVCASYAQDLADGNSRVAREVARSGEAHEVFDGIRPKKQKKSFYADYKRQDVDKITMWRVGNGASYKAVGIGGPLTGHGAHCFPAGTPVLTPSGTRSINDLKPGDSVWAYDGERGKVVSRRVLATMESPADAFVELEFHSGRHTRSTPSHPFFVPGRGYVEAQSLEPGDPVLAAVSPLQDLRQREGEACARAHLQGLLPEESVCRCHGDLQLVQGAGDEESLRGPQGDQEGARRPVLLPPLRESAPCHQESAPMRHLREALREEDAEVLLHPLQAEGDAGGSPEPELSALQDRLPPQGSQQRPLFEDMCRRGTLTADDWRGQLQLATRGGIPEGVPADAPSDCSEGRRELCCVLGDQRADAGPPHRRGHLQQRAGQPDPALQRLSRHAPQVEHDAVSVVRHIRGSSERVYDIQVEGTSNFFAGEVLVHNCLIVDDYFKDAAEARSPTKRDGVWSWYTTVARTRVAPGGGIIIMATRWDTDDLIGRLIAQAKADPEADQWEVLNFEAIATADEEHRKAGEALHEARWPVSELTKIRATQGVYWFSAMYQGNPIPDGGDKIKTDWIGRYTASPYAIAAQADEVWITSDAAKKGGTKSDLHSLQCWARTGARYTLLDRVAGRMEYPAYEAAMDAMRAKWRTWLTGTYIEDTANGATYIQIRRGEGGIHAFHPSKDTPGRDKSKPARFKYVERAASGRQIEIPAADHDLPGLGPSAQEWLTYVCAFPAEPDDDADATSQLIMKWELEAREGGAGSSVLGIAAAVMSAARAKKSPSSSPAGEAASASEPPQAPAESAPFRFR